MNYIRFCPSFKTSTSSHYKLDKNKILLLPENFNELWASVYQFKNSPWLPIEIKNKLRTLDFIAFMEEESIEDISNYIKLDIKKQGKDPWMRTHPEVTFEMYNDKMSEFLLEIESWIKVHSNVIIDLDLTIRTELGEGF